jgi:hypothetical protein
MEDNTIHILLESSVTGLVRHTHAQFLLTVIKRSTIKRQKETKKSKRDRERRQTEKNVHLFKYRVYLKCCSNY